MIKKILACQSVELITFYSCIQIYFPNKITLMSSYMETNVEIQFKVKIRSIFSNRLKAGRGCD